MRIFEYLFMQRAFVVGILLAAVVPCVGMVVVCKRLSMIGDALSHTSIAGVAAGHLLGVTPVAGAAAACVAASFGIEAIRRKRIDPDKEGMVNLVGIVLLFGLMFIVMFNDIRKLFI